MLRTDSFDFDVYDVLLFGCVNECASSALWIIFWRGTWRNKNFQFFATSLGHLLFCFPKPVPGNCPGTGFFPIQANITAVTLFLRFVDFRTHVWINKWQWKQIRWAASPTPPFRRLVLMIDSYCLCREFGMLQSLCLSSDRNGLIWWCITRWMKK